MLDSDFSSLEMEGIIAWDVATDAAGQNIAESTLTFRS
jgi:hypothetical protein